MKSLKVFVLFILVIKLFLSQEMQPAVLVTDENGKMATKFVYLGLMNCNNSKWQQTSRLELLERRVRKLEEANQNFPNTILEDEKKIGNFITQVYNII